MEYYNQGMRIEEFVDFTSRLFRHVYKQELRMDILVAADSRRLLFKRLIEIVDSALNQEHANSDAESDNDIGSGSYYIGNNDDDYSNSGDFIGENGSGIDNDGIDDNWNNHSGSNQDNINFNDEFDGSDTDINNNDDDNNSSNHINYNNNNQYDSNNPHEEDQDEEGSNLGNQDNSGNNYDDEDDSGDENNEDISDDDEDDEDDSEEDGYTDDGGEEGNNSINGDGNLIEDDEGIDNIFNGTLDDDDDDQDGNLFNTSPQLFDAFESLREEVERLKRKLREKRVAYNSAIQEKDIEIEQFKRNQLSYNLQLNQLFNQIKSNLYNQNNIPKKRKHDTGTSDEEDTENINQYLNQQ